MKILKFKKADSKIKKEYAKKTAGLNSASKGSDSDGAEMRLAFFSKGNIFLESGEASFKMNESQGLSLVETDCFGQLVCDDFCKLVNDCVQFCYNGSPVRFTVNFYSANNQLLGQLISDSIFTNVGFGRGDGEWVV